MLFHIQKIEDILNTFNTTKNGLTTKEANIRIASHGKNSLPKKRTKNLFEIFILQFKSPIIYVLLIATIISFAIGEFKDAYFILGVLFINAIIGTYQEYSANQKADSLQQIVKTYATVLRDGEKLQILSEEITIGDIVLVESGTKIPADIRIIEDKNLKVNESLLTGESVDVTKDSNFISSDIELPLGDRKNMLYAGSFVSSGRATGVVVAIGVKSEIGKIASLLASSREGDVPLIKKMEKFSLDIAKVIGVVVLLLFIIGLMQGLAIKDLFFLAVALSVSAIPEGLPVAITIVLTSASLVMSKRNVIVRKLASIEGLGSCTFIASDKTGTLTKNSLSVEKFINVDGKVFEKSGKLNDEVYKCAYLCNEVILKKEIDGFKYFGDQVDIALAKFALEAKIEYINLNYKKIDEIPYESKNGYSAVSYKIENNHHHYIKGSPEKILEFSNIHKKEKKRILNLIDEYSAKGYRNIALASKVDNKKLHLSEFEFLGFVAIIDPIRDEVKEAVLKAKEAGIEVAMVTGDHPNTAFFIASELSIASSMDEVINGEELLRWQERGGELSEIANKRVFARVSPEQKQLIVTLFQKLNHFVAVTGDGVNDAVALKYANIGIAMGKDGTDVARESSELILTDDNFSSIVNGIEEGRVAYDNIRKVTYLLISTGFAEVILIILSMLFVLPIPLLPVQLLWLNLVTNGIQHVALALEKAEPDILKRKPRDTKEKVFNYIMIRRVLVGGLYMGIMAFLVFLVALDLGYSEEMARNITLLLMVLFENVHVFNSRSEINPIHKINHLNNKLIIGSVIITQTIHIISMHIPFMQALLDIKPISIDMWFTLFGLALFLIVVMEVDKVFMKKKLKSVK